MRHVRVATLLATVVLASALFAAPAAAEPYPGSEWSEHYFPSEDGITMLHADVLRPKGLTKKDKTPVILTVSPYTNHSGATTEYDPGAQGPSNRFYDFLDLSRILKRGYTYVMVDLPGTGGSGGCNDWGGVREQEAAKAAVEWAASRPWSTGRVGMMGKSYDGWTGLMAMAQKPKGLAAVVSMEPVYSGYRYLYNNGVRYFNSLGTPALFQAVDAKPGSAKDDPFYNANGAPQGWCYGVNYGLQQQDDENSDFWRERDLLRFTKRSKVPLFLTQGFLETNTKPDAAFDFYNGLDGTKNRAWFGQFDHYRGWEKSGKDFQMGRHTFVKEMMRFLDRHVKGVSKKKAPTHRDPTIEVQDNLGRYRGERAWPPSDSLMYRNKLRRGTYRDDGSNSSTSASGVWTFSQPVKHTTWMAGEPVFRAMITGIPRANLAVNVYDVAPSGEATVVSRGTTLLPVGVPPHELKLELYGQDWVFKKGHRIGIRVSEANSDWWIHVPTATDVTIEKPEIAIPFLHYRRTKFLKSGRTPTLQSWKNSETIGLDGSLIKDADRKFNLPGKLERRRRAIPLD